MIEHSWQPTIQPVSIDGASDTYNYLSCAEEDRYIASLDPLKADLLLTTTVHHYNTTGCVAELTALVQQVLLPRSELACFDQMHARAATRDLGFLASALIKHGVELSAVPGLEESLLLLAQSTNEVPRDTLISFTSRNPTDYRMRTFTGLEEERLFVRSIQQGIQALPRCASLLEKVREYSLLDAQYGEVLQEAKQCFTALVHGMVEVRNAITPKTFSFQIQPYFPSFCLGQQLYSGPAGTQTPLILIDLILFGSSLYGATDQSDYRHYVDTNSQYLPPAFRYAIANALHLPSLVHRACEEASCYLSAPRKLRITVARSLRYLEEVLHPLMSFRFPHKKVADENFRVRPTGSKGSGGYTVEVLDMLLTLSTQALQRVGQLRKLLEQGSLAE